MAGIHNGQVNEQYLRDVDTSRLKTECDTEALLHLYKQKGEFAILKNIPGAYTLAIADKRRREVTVLRDRTGIKPGCLGWKDGKYGVASEDVAFRKNGGKFYEDLVPGYAYYLDESGDFRKEKVIESCPRFCFFEYNYLADEDSIIDGVSVRSVRQNLGRQMAEEFHPDDIDLVTFVPNCPETAAKAYAEALEVPFATVFYKMRNERSFQGTNENQRTQSINSNLYPLKRIHPTRMSEDVLPISWLRGKSVVSIDDSTVRGTVAKRERKLLKELGAEKTYHANYTPQIGIIGEDGAPRGCKFGIDMPPDDGFVARERNLEEISKELGMETFYISNEGMLNAFERAGMPPEHLARFCIGGRHPFD